MKQRCRRSIWRVELCCPTSVVEDLIGTVFNCRRYTKVFRLNLNGNAYHILRYVRTVSGRISQSISFRLDAESQRHLQVLEATGLTRSEAIREALRGAAERLRRREVVRREAELIAADQQDRHEMQQIAAFMESLRAEG